MQLNYARCIFPRLHTRLLHPSRGIAWSAVQDNSSGDCACAVQAGTRLCIKCCLWGARRCGACT